MTQMRVWMANHADGSPRKVWAAVIRDGKLITRWAAAGANLGKETEIDLKGATPSAKLAEMERDKDRKRYGYLGIKEISPSGEISEPLGIQTKQEPKGFFTLLATVESVALQKLMDAGYRIQRHGDNIIEVEFDGSVFMLTLQTDGSLTTGVHSEALCVSTMLAMTYLASKGKTQSAILVDPKGNPIKPVFNSVVEKFGKEAEPLRHIAEQLGLVPIALAKALKSSSGLFGFSMLNPT